MPKCSKLTTETGAVRLLTVSPSFCPERMTTHFKARPAKLTDHACAVRAQPAKTFPLSAPYHRLRSTPALDRHAQLPQSPLLQGHNLRQPATRPSGATVSFRDHYSYWVADAAYRHHCRAAILKHLSLGGWGQDGGLSELQRAVSCCPQPSKTTHSMMLGEAAAETISCSS